MNSRAAWFHPPEPSDVLIRECLLAEFAFTLERIGVSGGVESKLSYSRPPLLLSTPLTFNSRYNQYMTKSHRVFIDTGDYQNNSAADFTLGNTNDW